MTQGRDDNSTVHRFELLPVEPPPKPGKRPRAYVPKKYALLQPELVAEATAVLNYWNGVFRSVPNAVPCQVNGGRNKRLYCRLMDAYRENPEFGDIPGERVMAAISAYRADSVGGRRTSWKPFADWFSIEQVLKYTGQKWTAPPSAEAFAARQRATATATHLGLHGEAASAIRANETVCKHVRWMLVVVTRNNTQNKTEMQAYYRKLSELADLFERYDPAVQDKILGAALKVWAAWKGSAFNARIDKPQHLEAIALAMLDRSPKFIRSLLERPTEAAS